MTKIDAGLQSLWSHEWTRSDWTRRQSLDALAKGGLAAMLASASSARAPARPTTSCASAICRSRTRRRCWSRMPRATSKPKVLKVEKPTPVRSWSALVEGFAAGKFNLVHLLKPIPVWMRYNNKFPVKVLAWAHTNGSGIVVGGDSGITDFKGLGGKRIAVPYWYSMHNVVLQYALRQSGLKAVIKGDAPGPGETALQILAPPEMPAALAAGKIDGYIVAEPFNALGELKARARMLRFTGDIWKNHPCCVIAAHERDTVERPEWTQKLVNAVVKAQIYSSKNKAEVARLISADGTGALPLPGDVVVKAMTDYGAAYETTGAIKHRCLGQWPHRFPAVALSIGDQADRRGHERDGRRG